jgi:hypothetical protein
MKKILVMFVVMFTIVIAVSSCGGTKKGMGCPTANSAKPFRA